MNSLNLRLCLVLSIAALSFSAQVANAATVPAGFTDAVVAAGLTNPTAMALAPDGRIFVCQQNGALRVIKNGALLSTPFLTVTVDSSGERGLLGVAFDPNFVSNQLVYVYYTATTPSVHNRISRFTASGDVALAGSEVLVMDLPNLSTATNHNGGALHFGPDGNFTLQLAIMRTVLMHKRSPRVSVNCCASLQLALSRQIIRSSIKPLETTARSGHLACATRLRSRFSLASAGCLLTMWARTRGKKSTTASRARIMVGPLAKDSVIHRIRISATRSLLTKTTRKHAPLLEAPSTIRSLSSFRRTLSVTISLLISVAAG